MKKKIFIENQIENIKNDANLISSYLKHLTIRELISSAEILYSMDINNDELSNSRCNIPKMD